MTEGQRGRADEITQLLVGATPVDVSLIGGSTRPSYHYSDTGMLFNSWLLPHDPKNPTPQLIRGLSSEMQSWLDPKQAWMAVEARWGTLDRLRIERIARAQPLTNTDRSSVPAQVFIVHLKSPHPPLIRGVLDISAIFSDRFPGDINLSENGSADLYPRRLYTFSPIDGPNLPIDKRPHFTVVRASPTFDRPVDHASFPSRQQRRLAERRHQSQPARRRDLLIWAIVDDLYQFVLRQQGYLKDLKEQMEESFGIRSRHGIPNW